MFEDLETWGFLWWQASAWRKGVHDNFLPKCLGLIPLLRSLDAGSCCWIEIVSVCRASLRQFPSIVQVFPTVVREIFNRIGNSVCKSEICSEIWAWTISKSFTFLKVEADLLLSVDNLFSMLTHCTIISKNHNSAFLKNDIITWWREMEIFVYNHFIVFFSMSSSYSTAFLSGRKWDLSVLCSNRTKCRNQ